MGIGLWMIGSRHADAFPRYNLAYFPRLIGGNRSPCRQIVTKFVGKAGDVDGTVAVGQQHYIAASQHLL
jgi:hypothetical protein